MKEINLSHCNIGNDGVKILSKALIKAKHIASIETIDLGSNNLSMKGMKTFANAMLRSRHLSCLRYLNLSANHFGDGEAQILAYALAKAKHLTSLEVISLRNNRIGDAGAIALSVAIVAAHHLKTIEVIHLRGNCIGADGARALALAWKERNTQQDPRRNLTTSQLPSKPASWNEIHRNEGNNEVERKEHLNRILRDLREGKIEELNLCSHNIGDDGAQAVAKVLIALPYGNDLIRINLRENNIGARGAALLATALMRSRHLSKLQKFDLGNNSIGDKGAKALAFALVHSPHLSNLKHFCAKCNDISPDGAEALHSAWIKLGDQWKGRPTCPRSLNVCTNDQTSTVTYFHNNCAEDELPATRLKKLFRRSVHFDQQALPPMPMLAINKHGKETPEQESPPKEADHLCARNILLSSASALTKLDGREMPAHQQCDKERCNSTVKSPKDSGLCNKIDFITVESTEKTILSAKQQHVPCQENPCITLDEVLMETISRLSSLGDAVHEQDNVPLSDIANSSHQYSAKLNKNRLTNNCNRLCEDHKADGSIETIMNGLYEDQDTQTMIIDDEVIFTREGDRGVPINYRGENGKENIINNNRFAKEMILKSKAKEELYDSLKALLTVFVLALVTFHFTLWCL